MKKVKNIVGLEEKEVIREPEKTEVKDTSYLSRHAGLQTIRTSAKGLLSTSSNQLTRKKLLGE